MYKSLKKLFLLCHYYFILLFQTNTASSTLFSTCLWIFNLRRDNVHNAVMFLTIYAAITRFFLLVRFVYALFTNE